MTVTSGLIWVFAHHLGLAGAPTIPPPPPDWMKDLVIYEIAPKSFTSPKGPESGTFESLKARLPYLQDLGITGIWLTGHSLSDPHHFFNIWMQYACIEPDKIDPSLGTPEQFKAMIDEAHRRGIKIFLDVITHGLMPESPLVKKHPRWFRGGTWKMVDFDWSGGHLDLDDWWVALWTDYVTRYGIDGFRLDVEIYRPDLWARIRRNAAAAGHPIVIFEEGNSTIPGITDFSQSENSAWDPQLVDDVPAFYDRTFGRGGTYKIHLRYADETDAEGSTNGGGSLSVQLRGLVADKASRRKGDRTRGDGLPDVQLTVGNVADKLIQNITVFGDGGAFGQQWNLPRSGAIAPGLAAADYAEPSGLPDNAPALSSRFAILEGRAPTVQLYVPTLAHGYSSVLLSEHCCSYAARGSRAAFGYSFLFTPMIPLFMAGEEFDATFHAIPWMSPKWYSGADPGKGGMVYGSMLNWSELEQPRHRGMFEDVRRILAIRKREAALLTPVRGDEEPNLVAVGHTANIDVPVPYMRWGEGTGIIVMGNRNTEKDARIMLSIPLDKLGPYSTRYRVTDLWNGGTSKMYSSTQLKNVPYTIKRDKTPRGGLGVLKIERVD